MGMHLQSFLGFKPVHPVSRAERIWNHRGRGWRVKFAEFAEVGRDLPSVLGKPMGRRRWRRAAHFAGSACSAMRSAA